jgi:DNA segregation ATPase FtsK/SpoIIIE, S-DNA-T family
MGRKKKYKKNSTGTKLESARLVDSETFHGALALLFWAIGIFFLLAGFDLSGVAGRFVYGLFEGLFGVGFYIIPLFFLLIGFSLLKSFRGHFISSRLIGGGLFLLASLGLIEISLADNAGGLIGGLVARPLISLFEIYITYTFLVASLVISLMVIFESKITLENRLFGRTLGRRVVDEDFDDDVDTAAEEAIQKHASDQADDEDGEDSGDKKSDAIKLPPEPKKDETSAFGLALFGRKGGDTEFAPPPLSLLSRDSGRPSVGDIKANSNIIKRTLANFGITVEMDEISIGPSVTRYAFKPAEGMKLARIVALQNDLALALAAHPIRIEAPIPGKSLVGIEIPNTIKSTVGLGSLIATKEFSDSPLPLLISLGKGVSGVNQYTNLAKAPHLLIAGATGSGKSVTIHTVITSLLYRNPPEKLRFIMVDPKRVELTLYNKIPHLLTPVLTDPKKSIAALRWAAKEMDRRYNILEAESVRDIQSYHKNILEPVLAKAKANKKATDENDEVDDVERMPYIVVVIDELADIMSTYPRELEAAIVRLAQMSRAVGIHLIVSTQRPSVEVITGLIKANIPSRIALQVASQIDSRTIIDMAGAEKLLGAGDMLYLSGDMSKPVRLQSAFISEDEVKKVVGHLANQYQDELPLDINLGTEDTSNALFSTALDGDEDDDDLYEDAREAVVQAGKASASYLQRKLKVGYARAARLLDMLEERGVIGPGEGAKPRDVYVKMGEETNEQV